MRLDILHDQKTMGHNLADTEDADNADNTDNTDSTDSADNTHNTDNSVQFKGLRSAGGQQLILH